MQDLSILLRWKGCFYNYSVVSLTKYVSVCKEAFIPKFYYRAAAHEAAVRHSTYHGIHPIHHEYFTQNYVCEPHGGTKGKDSPTSVGLVLWVPWISVQNFISLSPKSHTNSMAKNVVGFKSSYRERAVAIKHLPWCRLVPWRVYGKCLIKKSPMKEQRAQWSCSYMVKVTVMAPVT